MPSLKNKTQVILLDGPDGAGKTTLIEALKAAASSHGYPLSLIVREPGGSPLGEEVRRLLKSGAFKDRPETALMALAAQRFELQRAIKHMLKRVPRGMLIIQDRGIYSTVAYNLPDLAGTPLALEFSSANFWWGPYPELYKNNFILNTPLELCRERMRKRRTSLPDEPVDVMDQDDERQRLVHERYLSMSDNVLPPSLQRRRVLDGKRTVDELVLDVFTTVRDASRV